MYNVPDDWGLYYDKCYKCGDRTHASENYACSCVDEEHEEPFVVRYSVCSKTANIKVTSIYATDVGGIRTELSYIPADNWHINRYLTLGQIKWRNNLLRRLSNGVK